MMAFLKRKYSSCGSSSNSRDLTRLQTLQTSNEWKVFQSFTSGSVIVFFFVDLFHAAYLCIVVQRLRLRWILPKGVRRSEGDRIAVVLIACWRLVGGMAVGDYTKKIILYRCLLSSLWRLLRLRRRRCRLMQNNVRWMHAVAVLLTLPQLAANKTNGNHRAVAAHHFAWGAARRETEDSNF